jgi:hypothetical protein
MAALRQKRRWRACVNATGKLFCGPQRDRCPTGPDDKRTTILMQDNRLVATRRLGIFFSEWNSVATPSSPMRCSLLSPIPSCVADIAYTRARAPGG